MRSSESQEVSCHSSDQSDHNCFQENDPDDMRFSKSYGTEDTDLSLSLVHRGHHIGEHDQAPDQENND